MCRPSNLYIHRIIFLDWSTKSRLVHPTSSPALEILTSCHPSWVASTAMAVSICNLFRTLPGSNCAITLGVEGCLLEMTQIAFEGVGLLGKIAREDGNKKSLLLATSFHQGIKALQPETKIESLNAACANLHPTQSIQSNQIHQWCT